MIILDTDHVSLLQRNDGHAAGRILHRLSSLPTDEIVVTTIITYEEQTRGWFALLARARSLAAQVETYDRLLKHLDYYRRIPVLPFDDQAAVEFQKLRRLRLRAGSMDLKIAAISLSRNALLVWRNRRDFQGVSGLRFEDWT